CAVTTPNRLSKHARADESATCKPFLQAVTEYSKPPPREAGGGPPGERRAVARTTWDASELGRAASGFRSAHRPRSECSSSATTIPACRGTRRGAEETLCADAGWSRPPPRSADMASRRKQRQHPTKI